MSNYRPAGLALAACAASLTVAACTSGGITTTPPATTSAASAPSASAAATTASSGSSASSGQTIALGGSIGSFPLPVGAKVADNVDINKRITVYFSGVTPAKILSFYKAALPQAGYTVTMSITNNEGGAETIFEFTGHGYEGGVLAYATSPGKPPGVSVPGFPTKNVAEVTFRPE
jgi:hypothetical protein